MIFVVNIIDVYLSYLSILLDRVVNNVVSMKLTKYISGTVAVKMVGG